MEAGITFATAKSAERSQYTRPVGPLRLCQIALVRQQPSAQAGAKVNDSAQEV